MVEKKVIAKEDFFIVESLFFKAHYTLCLKDFYFAIIT